MPPSCCRPDYDGVFDERAARRELAGYRCSGPSGTTRRLVDAIRAEGVEGASILDIGGGVGVVGMELLAAGAATLTDVEAARAYLAAARSEAERQGVDDRVTFVRGDFVDLAAEVPAADVVTLDRVLCCYGDWRSLVERSATHARRLIGLVYPTERWWMRLIVGAGNVAMRVAGRRFRFHVHPERGIDGVIRSHGFRPVLHERGLMWQTVLYERAA